MSDNNDESCHARQKLMDAEEVYVYKIPPLKSAGGHRAEDWNLSNPLQTCRLLVELAGDTLIISFLTQDDGKLFAESTVDASKGDKDIMQHWLEQVVDSSRYFALKIQGAGGREATIGFGFRDREQATDLRECLQYYEKSIRREQTAASISGSFSLPKLAQGEKIHVDRKSGKATKVKASSSDKKKGVPLLKKPPPSPPAEEKPKVENAKPNKQAAIDKKVQKMNISMGNIDLNDNGDEEEEGSDGAVYEGDESQWATEFDMK